MRWTSLGALVACVAASALLPAGCDCGAELPVTTGTAAGGSGGENAGGAGGEGNTFNPTSNGGSGGGDTPCVGLECLQVDCDGGATTSISGTIYDPSGTLPLYNVGVYVPNGDLDPVPDDISCEPCDATFSGNPLVSALTDTEGRFVIDDMPAGDDIPLVIQVGKWRRVITIPTVAACVDNPLDDPQEMRLPRSMAEGNIPRIALTTGNSDALFCLLRRLGIDDAEFGCADPAACSAAGPNARIHFFHGVNGSDSFAGGFGSSPGANLPEATTALWDGNWENYDIVMMSCEGSEQRTSKDTRRPRLRDYLDAGGRVFGTHYHYDWFRGPAGHIPSPSPAGDAPADLDSVADFKTQQTDFSGKVDIDQSFPKGVAMAEWMDFVSDINENPIVTSMFGQFQVNNGRLHTVSIDSMLARNWATYQGTTVYFSFNAPIGDPPEEQCGRMVNTDIHVSAGSPSGAFPTACESGGMLPPLTEQEKALIFMLFDLSACITPDDEDPCPPGQAHCGSPGDEVCPGQCVDNCCQPGAPE